LESKQPLPAPFESDTHLSFTEIQKYETIVYTIGLGKTFLKYNYTMDRIYDEEYFSHIYSNGFSDIAIRTRNPN
jgi:hypothetical protein